MHEQTISRIVSELKPLLEGRAFGKVFQLSRLSLAIDFRTGDGRYLFLSVEPSAPRLYMIARRTRDLEKQSQPSSSFIFAMRKHMGGGTLISLTKDEGERIVRFSFSVPDALGMEHRRQLIAQLTGRAANLLLVDEDGYIRDALRPPRGEGQEIGDRYEPPPSVQKSTGAPDHTALSAGSFASLSEAADDYYLRLEAKRAFASSAAAARARLRKAIAQRRKLHGHLLADLRTHGSAEEHKRIGDLLLANIGSAERSGNVVTVTDYYAENTPRIELELDENSTLQAEAARRFARYAKARRAAQEIAGRLHVLEEELSSLEARQNELESIIAGEDEAALRAFGGDEAKQTLAPRRAGSSAKAADGVPGARRYRSSDGYEILVGRAARDNDHLTFRVARPHDMWLHAADYPGSHVLIRNSTRKEIPHRTIVEAAQLAANFSHARRDAKVTVHYTPRKFLMKPKGAAPGLVRMSSFRTITVEPRESVERI
ncbi:MAG TPA: NFACT RNA binding domain-containing protein [Pyrinomonadaceae bacterium]|nr:NFACT RNA binding domain-containing protein [Pyrinomonadaceae bacterium]